MSCRWAAWSVPVVMTLGLLFLNATPAHAVLNITITGSWSQSIDKNNLTGGTGTNLTSTYTSAQNANQITITDAKNRNDRWQVTVRRIDTTWNSTLQLLTRRTSNGSGDGSISGGQTYIQVTTSATTFFTGAGNRSSIAIQFQLTGASLQVSPSQYVTTIQYTIVDTP